MKFDAESAFVNKAEIRKIGADEMKTDLFSAFRRRQVENRL